MLPVKTPICPDRKSPTWGRKKIHRKVPCTNSTAITNSQTAMARAHIRSSTVAEQNHIAFLHDVLFSFQANLGLLFRGRNASRRHQVVPAHHFRANEALFD